MIEHFLESYPKNTLKKNNTSIKSTSNKILSKGLELFNKIGTHFNIHLN